MASEFALIEQLLRQSCVDVLSSCRPPILGPGDDCALIDHSQPGLVWAVTTDMLVAGVHFLDSDEPYHLGWKTLAVNLSDLAAMGAQPRFVSLAAAIRAEDAENTTWIETFFSGFIACARTYDVLLIGGDTTRGERTFSVTAMGEVPAHRALRRSAAQAGDDIWISGSPGYAALGLDAKLKGIILPKATAAATYTALHQPQPRIQLGLALREIAHSAIDVSDGLVQDLGHIARASQLNAILSVDLLPCAPVGVDAMLWERCLLGGGDDYELLFTAPSSARDKLITLSQQLELPLHHIGHMQSLTAATTAPIVQLLDATHQPRDITHIRLGFDHFASHV